MDANGEIRKIAIASVVLGAGVLVYLFERQGASVYLLPQEWVSIYPASWLGQHLPSFSHAFAFTVLTAVVLAPWRCALTASCLFWVVVDSLFEFGQIDAVAVKIAEHSPAWLEKWPFLDNLDNYFLAGTFDPLDICFAVLGAVVAYSTGVLLGEAGTLRC